MIQAIEALRNVAGVMFWALADLLLGGVWCVLLFGLLKALVDGFGHHDN